MSWLRIFEMQFTLRSIKLSVQLVKRNQVLFPDHFTTDVYYTFKI